MTVLTLSLELDSLRLVELANVGNSLVVRREEMKFFSRGASHRKIFIQEVREALQKIKKSWSLSHEPLHCIFSSDFALLRVATFKKPSCFTSTAKLVQRDAEEFIPLPLEQVSLVYQKIDRQQAGGPKTVAYAAIKIDFLEAVVEAIREAGFHLQKVSILSLALCSLPIFGPTLLIDAAEQSINFLILSPEKIFEGAYFRLLSNWNDGFCEQQTGMSLLLLTYLKKELHSFIHANEFSGSCWISKTHSSSEKILSLSRFLKQEFPIVLTDIEFFDPCFLLQQTSKTSCLRKFFNKIQFLSERYLNEKILLPQFSWKRFLKINSFNISSVDKFTPPFLVKFHSRQRALLFIFFFVLFVPLFSSLSLLHDSLNAQKIVQETSRLSACLKQRESELQQLHRDATELAEKTETEEKFKECQCAHDQWPRLIVELQQCAPQRGIWITQLTPVLRTAKEKKEPSEIVALAIKGLYLEGMNGEELVREYANKLVKSPLFAPTKETSFFSYTKEDGTAYAYSFTIQLQLSSPIQL